MHFEFDAEFFVALAFVCFVGVAIYFGAAKRMTIALDARAKKIAAELEEASRLRAEAEALLASFQQKAAQADADAAAMLAHVKVEADAMAAEGAERMRDFIERRRKQADAKIALAEQQAAAQVRAAAADAATRAAAIVLKAQPDAVGDLVSQGIEDLKRLMH